MRCSECFAEMKEGPDGPYCDACGLSMTALVEEGQLSQPAAPKPVSKRRWVWGVSAILIAVLGGAGAWAYQTGLIDTFIASETEAVAATIRSRDLLPAILST